MSTAGKTPKKRLDGTGLIEHDPWLAPYAEALRRRFKKYQDRLAEITRAEGSLLDFAGGHHYFGLNRGFNDGQPGVWYREWAPGAEALSLIGDFNGWDRHANPLVRDQFGVWSTFLPDEQYANRLVHGSRLKVHVDSAIGPIDHIPAYIRRAIYEPQANAYTGQYWNPPEPYQWRNPVPRIEGSLRIYEAHVGMATEEHRCGTYREFTQRILGRIVSGGYNAVQLMAVQEHPYYGSFGYHVSNFFAASSRFGTPEELKELIDTAHGMGLLVLMDIVHSHAVKNIHDGLNMLDGTDHQYFHAGPRGQHPAWDSLLFDYGKWEVLRFLLSNVRFWLEEYHFDGFRFDGVTSMMYLDHGLGRAFTSYDDYLKFGLDEDAITYLQLANQVAHEFRPDAITIAEDVSGMVGIARPLSEGGLGFDYRLAMGIPDYWIKILKERRDEEWQMGELYHVLINRRYGEKHVAYAESHDQALVGDKTIAFRLMDADMYWHMSKLDSNPVIDRGVALHKMIRLITFSLGGEAYLNFMGNEFGHPEWIDFPRPGNNFSHKYARRQWSLVDDPTLRYHDLNEFDRAMLALDVQYNLLADRLIEQIHVHEDNKLLAYRRGPLVFVFNFHPSRSYPDYRIGVPDPADYRLVLNTDDFWFSGHGIVQAGQHYPWQAVPWHGRKQSIQIYIPARTAQVLAPVR
ncbi:MAG TPA: alpha amylase C-terminal domain-containing protein [Phycisphaerae bacterium]|jgi:1,4-alpha-glucan branching enzyme|nr:1,4-alpha-glucan-branching enzyme [Phycisphaerae bacterium]HOB74949.1 alpha amylase C-terminal domain-containing protein [Phycisphaerae bacterium]HOJ56087.1 alpha amylase C-terminal domain-containing protein [Phycisphaerae bacterium]HOL25774.1 alpha amylase C-terminal domain-containing protein [Phycisphaerae bacterium]HPP19533.1 alpha amylase C-terminal domain-containing protein [Phycisphaerae bacterium]